MGFGALMTATFKPLAEMGLVTSVGVALTLAGGFWLIPAILHLKEGAKGEIKSSAADRKSFVLPHEVLPRFDQPHPQKWAKWRAYPLKARRRPCVAALGCYAATP